MFRTTVVLFFGVLLASCSSAVKIEPVAAQYRSPELIYFVENHGQDKRRLDQIIASEFNRAGLKASSGFKTDRPAHFDILVVYEDRWQWDITNYLIHMRIDLRSPKTNVLFGSGSSYQTSLARQPEAEVIRTIVGGMLAR